MISSVWPTAQLWAKAEMRGTRLSAGREVTRLRKAGPLPFWAYSPEMTHTSSSGSESAAENGLGWAPSSLGADLIAAELASRGSISLVLKYPENFSLGNEKEPHSPLFPKIFTLPIWKGEKNAFFLSDLKLYFPRTFWVTKSSPCLCVLFGDPFVCWAIVPVYTELGRLQDDFPVEDITLCLAKPEAIPGKASRKWAAGWRDHWWRTVEFPHPLLLPKSPTSMGKGYLVSDTETAGCHL